MSLKQPFRLLVLLLTASQAVAAQLPPAQEPAAATEQQQKAQKELEKKALALLEEVIADAQGLKLVENRIQVLVTVAGALWPRDEKRARAVYNEVISQFGQLMAGIDDRTRLGHQYRNLAYQLRHEILQTIARRDPVLAREFLLATRPTQPPAVWTYPGSDQETALELSIVSQIAARDPKEAVRLAEESLAKGVSHRALSLAQQLRAKDQEAAGKILGALVKRLRTEDFNANHDAVYVTLSLLRSQLGATRAQVGPAAGRPAPPALLLDEAAMRELMEVAVTAALKSSAADNPLNPNRHNMSGELLIGLQSLLPEVEKYAPAQAPALRARLAQFTKGLDEPTRALNEFRALQQGGPGSVEGMLEVAPRLPAEMREHAYQQAVWSAVIKGDVDQARQIINDYIPESTMRQELIRTVNHHAVMQSIKGKKLAEARQLITQLFTDEERPVMLARLAQAAAASDKKLALELLEEARGLVGNQSDDPARFDELLQIARAYAALDPGRAFEIIEPIIDQVNTFVTAAAVVARFRPHDYSFFREGELVGSGQFSILFLLREYQELLRPLAVVDFDRARAAAERFSRNDVRVLVRLAVAQSALARPEAAAAAGAQY